MYHIVYTFDLCDLCDLLCFNDMPTELYGSEIASTTVWDYPSQLDYLQHSIVISNEHVKTSLSHWGSVTVNTVTNIFDVIHGDCKFPT